MHAQVFMEPVPDPGVMFALSWLSPLIHDSPMTDVQKEQAVHIGLIVGGGVAVVTGPTLAFVRAVWGSYTIARLWLALFGRLPMRLLPFLQDAHLGRGVLRQVGATYQFRHVAFQRHLIAAARQRAQRQADRRPTLRLPQLRPAESDSAP